jgi:hypothetical protein
MLVGACLAAAVSLPAQVQDRVTELRSLNDFRAPRRQAGLPFGGTLLPAFAEGHVRTLVAAIGDAESYVLDVPAIMARRCQAEIAAGRLELEPHASALLVRGEKALVEGCLRQIDALQAAVTRPIEVTAMLWEGTAGSGPGAVVGAEGLAELQRQAPSWTARARSRPGREVALGRERWTRYVRDVDVEVNKNSVANDPKVDAAMAGVRVVAAVHPLPEGDDLLLIGSFAVGENAGMREAPASADGPTVDLPEWRSASGTFAARIQNGGAAVVVARAASTLAPAFTLAVSARCLGPAVSVVAPGFQVLPVSALCTPAHLRRAALGSAVRLPGDDSPSIQLQEEIENDAAQVPADALLRLIAVDGVTCTVEQGFLLVEAEPGRDGAVGGPVQKLCEQRLRNAELRVELADPAGRTALLSMTQPAMLGREAWFFLGREQACVADLEVEIQESAAAANPVIHVAQAGIWSRVRLRPGSSGPTCDALWQVAAQSAPRERPVQGKPGGTLGLITTDVAAFSWDAPMPLGRAHDLGDGPPFLIDAKVVPSRLSFQVTAR